jgi:hypothetical protein
VIQSAIQSSLAGISISQLTVIVAVSMLTSILGGVTGYGTGALMPLLLVPIVGAEPVVPIIAMSAIITNVSRALAFRRAVDWRRVGIVVAAAIPTCILGAWAYTLLTGRGAMVMAAGLQGAAVIATDKWSIQFSRKVRKPDGSFGGVIVISLDPSFVDTFYETVDLGEHGVVTIRNLDAVVLARRGVAGSTLGRQVALQMYRSALARAPSGHYWSRGETDGVKRLVAYRASERFPLIFSVGRAESNIFKGLERNRITYIAIATIITLLVLIAVGLGIHHQKRLDGVRDNLRRSEADARERAHELEVKSREIAHIAHHDILTGLANRILLTIASIRRSLARGATGRALRSFASTSIGSR